MESEFCVYKFTNYVELIRNRITSIGGGRGSYARLATWLRVDASFVSHVMAGSRDLSSEQALLVAEFLNLSGSELEYFVTLVEWSRAGTEALKKLKVAQLDRLKPTSPTCAIAHR